MGLRGINARLLILLHSPKMGKCNQMSSSCRVICSHEKEALPNTKAYVVPAIPLQS
jgi:hypothetical protein